MKSWIQFQHHRTIIGMAIKIIAVSKGLDGVEQRCEYVTQILLK